MTQYEVICFQDGTMFAQFSLNFSHWPWLVEFILSFIQTRTFTQSFYYFWYIFCFVTNTTKFGSVWQSGNIIPFMLGNELLYNHKYTMILPPYLKSLVALMYWIMNNKIPNIPNIHFCHQEWNVKGNVTFERCIISLGFTAFQRICTQ